MKNATLRQIIKKSHVKTFGRSRNRITGTELINKLTASIVSKTIRNHLMPKYKSKNFGSNNVARPSENECALLFSIMS